MLNLHIIHGRVVRDMELRASTTAGTPVVSFTVAVDRDHKEADGTRKADFIDCVAWRDTAEFIARNFVKGQEIALYGRHKIREWTDKDGNKRRGGEIEVQGVDFCGPKREAEIVEADDNEPLPF